MNCIDTSDSQLLYLNAKSSIGLHTMVGKYFDELVNKPNQTQYFRTYSLSITR